MAATWCATPREPHALAGRTAHMQSLELHGRVIHVLHCTKLQHEHHRTFVGGERLRVPPLDAEENNSGAGRGGRELQAEPR